MMQWNRMGLGPLQTNCYFAVDAARAEAIVIDPGMNAEPLVQALQGLRVTAVLLTHCHYDHIAGLNLLKEATGAPIWAPLREAEWLTNPTLNRSGLRPELFPTPITGPEADRLLEPGETFRFGDQTWRVLFTPGHTPGHLTFVTDGIAIVGDTLFHGSIGRTDLPEGSTAQLIESIHQVLFALPDETTVAPGHGDLTTIGLEKEQNPFVGRRGRHPAP